MRLLDVRSTIPSDADSLTVCRVSQQFRHTSSGYQTSLIISVGSLLLAVVRNKYQKGLILAQNERWRHGLGMQVEREPARGTAANGVGIPR